MFDDPTYMASFESTFATYQSGRVQSGSKNVIYSEMWMKNVPAHTELERLCIGFLNKPKQQSLLAILQAHGWKAGNNCGNAYKSIKKCLYNKQKEVLYILEGEITLSLNESQKLSSIKLYRSKADVSNGQIKSITFDDTTSTCEQFESEKNLEYLEKKKRVYVGKVIQTNSIEVQQFPIHYHRIMINQWQLLDTIPVIYVRDLVSLVD